MTNPETLNQPGSRRRTLITLRFLSLVILVALLMSRRSRDLYDPEALILLGLYLASIVAMFLLKTSFFEGKPVLFSLFALDTLLVSTGLYLSGLREWDLVAFYFLTILLAALAGDVKAGAGIGVLSCLLYFGLQWRLTGQGPALDTPELLKYPFLMVVALFSGYLAADSRAREEMARHMGSINEAISEQADRAIQKLVASERHLAALVLYHRLILGSIQTGIVVVHHDGRVKTFNPAAARITGVEGNRAEGRLLSELPDSFRPVAELMERSLREGKPYLQENLVIQDDRGEGLPVSLQTQLLSGGGGGALGVIATIKDLSLVKQMELQMRRSEKLAGLGEMAAAVAHEIKNPLNAVLGFAQRLSAKLDDPRLRDYAGIIVTEVNRMAAIVNDVLEYNRYRAPEKKPADLAGILDEVLVLVADRAAKAGVEVAVEADPLLPPVPMDRDKMKQVLLNLVLNAVNAMENGGTLAVRVRMETGALPAGQETDPDRTLLQQVFLQQRMVSVTVRDTGCGIARENLQKIFDPFFTTKTSGTGLGLSVCHKIVESHGGFMHVESRLGEGSEFSFYLPLPEEREAAYAVA